MAWRHTTFWQMPWHGYCSMSHPAADGGVVYIGGGYAWSGRTALYAFDAKTGRVRWRTPLGGRFTHPKRPLQDQRRVYLTTINKLAAFDKQTGEEEWSIPRVPSGGALRTELIAGRRLIASGFRGGPILTALDTDTGDRLWEARLEQARRPDSSPALLADAVYFLDDAVLKAIDVRNGNMWTPTPVLNINDVTPLTDGRYLYVVVPLPVEGTRWVRFDPQTQAQDTLSYNLAAIDNGVRYEQDGPTVRAVSVATGELLWASDRLQEGPHGGTAFLNGATYQATVYDIRTFLAQDVETGSVLWRHRTGDFLTHAVAVGDVIVAASDDCRVYAFRPDR